MCGRYPVVTPARPRTVVNALPIGFRWANRPEGEEERGGGACCEAKRAEEGEVEVEKRSGEKEEDGEEKEDEEEAFALTRHHTRECASRQTCKMEEEKTKD